MLTIKKLHKFLDLNVPIPVGWDRQDRQEGAHEVISYYWEASSLAGKLPKIFEYIFLTKKFVYSIH